MRVQAVLLTLATAMAWPVGAGEAPLPEPRTAPAPAPAPEVVVHFRDSEGYTFTAEDRREVESLAAAAVAEIADLLRGVPERIELRVDGEGYVIPETGDVGGALAPGTIGWTVDPERPGGVVGLAREHLRSTLFHEVHHLVRGWTMRDGTAGTRIIDAAVAEGLATAFERDGAGWSPPWGQYPPDEVAAWVEEILALPASASASYPQWMFQHPDGRRWIGYRAGTYLADRAMAASGRSAAELVTMPTDELVALAREGAGEER